jgi:hypothetical protein
MAGPARDVRFEGQSGSRISRQSLPLMTLMRHWPPQITPETGFSTYPNGCLSRYDAVS